MKIASRYKEFYTSFTTLYGESFSTLLDRKEEKNPLIINNGDKVQLYVGGYYTEGLYLNDKFIWGEDLKLLDSYDTLDETYWRAKSKAKSKYEYYHDPFFNRADVDRALRRLGNNSREGYVFVSNKDRNSTENLVTWVWKKDPHLRNKNLNLGIFIEQVGVLDYTVLEGWQPKIVPYPSLSQLNLATPFLEKIYQTVYNFLSE